MNLFNLSTVKVANILEAAFKKCGLYASGMGLSGGETSTALASLNVILNNIQNKYPYISNESEFMIPLKESGNVLGDDGYEYRCIKGHRAINTWPDDSNLSAGDLVYNKDENNYIVYQISFTAPVSGIASATWPQDKGYYYYDSDAGIYFTPYDSLGDYAYSARPNDGDLYNVYFEKSDTSWNLVTNMSYSVGDYVAAKPGDINRTILWKVTTPFTYSTLSPALSYVAWQALATEQSTPLPYTSETYYNAYDKIKLPNSISSIKMVNVLDTINNRTDELKEITYTDMISKYNRSNNGTEPSCYAIFNIGNDKYLSLYPIINQDSNSNALKLDVTLKYKNIDSASDSINMPDEFIRLIELELAQDIGIAYGVDSTTIQLITAKLAEVAYDIKLKFKYTDSDFDYIGRC